MNSDFISGKAKIHSSVKIGPYCVIGENVEIGENCILQSHVVIFGSVVVTLASYRFQSYALDSQPVKSNVGPICMIVSISRKQHQAFAESAVNISVVRCFQIRRFDIFGR